MSSQNKTVNIKKYFSIQNKTRWWKLFQNTDGGNTHAAMNPA
jgi:hypothetical protein